jgi:phosphoglycolate phosphatase-like HAD superfamily hydrolase
MPTQSDNSWSLSGQVVTGAGQGAGFTQLDWATKQFIAECGINPYPGTLNIVLTDEQNFGTWQAIKSNPGIRLRAGDPHSCDAWLYPIWIGGELPAAIVLPEVSGYPENQIEIIAALPLREYLCIGDGDLVRIGGQDFSCIKAIIFDVDGTLLNSLDGYRVAAHRAAAAHGYEVTLETVRQALNSNQPFWELVIPAEQAADVEFVQQLRRETMAHWPAAMAAHVSVLPGAEFAFRTLRDQGIRLAIYTGSDGESLPVLEEAGLLDFFDPIITGRQIKKRKPDPEGILQCLEILATEPGESVYVGDSVIDVKASQAAGVRSVSMLTGAGDSTSLSSAGTHRVLGGLAGLPGLFL